MQKKSHVGGRASHSFDLACLAYPGSVPLRLAPRAVIFGLCLRLSRPDGCDAICLQLPPSPYGRMHRLSDPDQVLFEIRNERGIPAQLAQRGGKAKLPNCIAGVFTAL